MNTSPPFVRILQLSDLHFGPPYIEKVGAAVQKLAPELNADAIVVSGDFTHRARASQFEAARLFLDQLPDVPRLYVPGNHDVPLLRLKERMLNPHGLYRRYICSDLNPVLDLQKVLLVGIDSTAPYSAVSNGRIQQSQLDSAHHVLASAHKNAARFVVAHHHFAPAPDYLFDRAMPQARRAILQFVDDGVDMILGGHLHRAFIGNTLDFYPGVQRDRGIVIVQSGTTTSRKGRGREREKNSFNVIDVADATLTVTHYLYFEAEDCFLVSSRHQFPRRSASQS